LPSSGSVVEFKIFQFPANAIPRIDGKADDWEMVPKEYTIGMDQLSDTVGGRGTKIDRKDKDVSVRVDGSRDLNRLYFPYESYDDFWTSTRPILTRHFRDGRGR
jgi:hypothetical protein